MLSQFVRDLAGDASDGEEVFRVRIREIFRGLEARIDQGLGPHLADSLDPAQFVEDARRHRLRGLSVALSCSVLWLVFPAVPPRPRVFFLGFPRYARRASSSRPIFTNT